MDRSDCCIVAPSRGTAPGTPARWLTAAWHEAAERGRPACVVVLREGVLVVAWANRALAALLGRDVGDLAGRTLRELGEEDGGAEPVVGPVPPVLAALLPASVPDGATPSVGWARLAHQLARAGGGSGVAVLRQVDGADGTVRVGVTTIDVGPSGPPETGPGRPGSPGRPVPGGGRHVPVPGGPAEPGRAGSGSGSGSGSGAGSGGPGSAATSAPAVARLVEGRSSATVPPAGVIGELAPPDAPQCWLVDVEAVVDAVAEAELAVTVAEHRFAALAGCAPVGIFASDAGLRLGYVNDHFVGLTGVPEHELLGNGWLDAVHRDDLPAVYTAVQTVLGGAPVELAVRLSARRGVQRWLQLRLAPTTTPARAAGFIGTAEDVTDRRSWEEHLTYQAQHDPLTGLVNRRRLIEVLTELLGSRRGRDRDFAVLFLDLDGFKEVNDALGHDAGDRALIEVARRMQRVARESDVLARVAGDEFVVILRNISNEAEAEAAARRHLGSLAAPLRIGATDIRLSASIGVALPAGFDTPDSLLRAADRVMYEAKAAGQGLYRLAPVGPTKEGR